MRPTAAVLIGAVVLSARLAPGAEKETAFLVDDFERGDRISASGASWAPLCDSILGGKSTLRLSVVGPKGKRALRGEGTLAEKGIAGAWVALDGTGRAVDLREFRAMRFKVRGSGAWLAGLRAGAMPMDNYMAPVSGTDAWTNVEIPLSVLRSKSEKAADLGEVRWLGFQAAPGRTGGFAFELDDVELVGAARPASPHGPRMQGRVPKTTSASLAAAAWTELGTDPAGDGKVAELPDLVSLATFRDGETVWFRLTTVAPVGPAFGVNLVFDTGAEPTKAQPWWGSNTAFEFDRLVTAWVFDTSADAFEGTIGISTAENATKGAAIDDTLGAPKLAVDGRNVYVGVPRAVLGGGAHGIRVLAAVGSPMKHNDDLPDTGALAMTP